MTTIPTIETENLRLRGAEMRDFEAYAAFRMDPVRTAGVGAGGIEQRGWLIGILCDDARPLCGLVDTIAPAIAMGNRVTCVASEPFPLAATDFYQVLETSDVPAGVVNILTGSHSELAPTLAAHLDLDAVWSFSSSDLSATIEKASAGNLKRTWVNNCKAIEPMPHDFLAAATEVKNIWIPYGE